MKLRPSHRLVAAVLALVSLPFMQLAVAAYACPMQAHETAAPMADCHGMGRASPTLCQAHAEPVKPSLDKATTPAVQPFVAAAVLFEVAGLDQLMPRSASVAPSSYPPRAPRRPSPSCTAASASDFQPA